MINEGLEIPDVREIAIVRHLPEEERSSIKFVHLYGSGRSSFDGASALYVTANDEVFLAGFDSLVGKSCREKVPTWHKGVLEKSVKVKELSGKAVQRIVVGEEFGAALTTTGDLYLWGTDMGPVGEIPAGLSRMAMESHYGGDKCPRCSQKLVPGSNNPSLSVCTNCGRSCHNRVSSFPPPTSWTGRPRTVLGFSTTATQPPVTDLFCLHCGVFRGWYTFTLSGFNILGCPSCFRLYDGDQYLIPPQNNPAPHKVTFPTDLHIVDIAGGKNFLLIQTSSKLIIWGDLGGQKHSRAISNPDEVSFTKVLCGSAHIAVITDQGDLYTCGVGDGGQLGYTWAATDGCLTLKKVTLKAPAVDVACGLKSTVCLLQNGTYVTFGTVTKIFISGTFSMNLLESAVVSVPLGGFHDKVMKSSLSHLLQPDRKCSVRLTGDLVDAFLILCGLKSEKSRVAAESSTSVHDAANQTDVDPSEDLKSADAEFQDNGSRNEPELEERLAGAESESPSHTQLNSNGPLFGQHLFSDLTLKLADGDFPVHRYVLYTSSAYFKQIFSDSKSSAVLDMSSYNPSAYRGLLQYFYGVPLTQMTCEDTFDLHILATSYKEDWIAADVLSKLKADITADNVLLLLNKARAANATELLEECQAFITTPEFKKSLLDRASQDVDAIVELLQFFSVTKN